MNWYVVSYDLRKEVSAKAWADLGRALRTALDWCRPLHSFWIVKTPLTPSGVINVLLNAGVIDDNDGIVVLEVTGKGNYRRVIDQDVADWLDSHLALA
jgi:hypothetical protein